MNHISPITHRPAFNNFPIHNQEHNIIDSLKKQNDFLKKQLQMIIQSQQYRKNNNFTQIQTSKRDQSFEQAENTYRNKIDKLKNRKSLSKKKEGLSTNASSSKNIDQHLNMENSIKLVPPKTVINDLRLAPMVLVQDKFGKYFRDRQSEEKIKTLRNQSNSVMNSPRNLTKVASVQGITNYFPLAQSPRLNAMNQKILIPEDKTIRMHKKNNTSYFQSNDYMYKNINQQKDKQIMKIEPKNLPKGNKYILKIQQDEQKSNLRSNVSIEQSLKQNKLKSKLNFNVYMDENDI